MILEHLISAYLDGELTPEQDRELRESLASDPAARQAFDAAVLIHIGLQCEDRTVPPADLRSSVFAAVDVIAAEEQHHAATLGISKRPINVVNRSAGVLAIMLLILCIPVADLVMDRKAPMATVAPVDTPQTAVTTINVRQTKKPRLQETMQNTEASVAEDVTAEFAEKSESGNVQDQQNVATPDVPLSAYLGGLSASTTLPGEHGQVISAAEQPLPVFITTSYAAGMASTVPGATDVRQISASLAYGVSDRGKVGLEVGSTSYAMTRDMTVLTGHASSAGAFASAKPVGQGGGSGKLSSPEPNNADYQSSTVTVRTEERQFWGTAFYEHKLFSYNSISVQGRLAAGVGEDGLLGYGRLMGEWKVAGGISIVAGAETRAMPFQTGGVGGANTSATYGAVVTALTGLNIRF